MGSTAPVKERTVLNDIKAFLCADCESIPGSMIFDVIGFTLFLFVGSATQWPRLGGICQKRTAQLIIFPRVCKTLYIGWRLLIRLVATW